MRLIPEQPPAMREAVIAAARSFIGCPWRHQGRTERGMDCIGMVSLAFRKAGITPPGDRIDYGRRPHNKRLSAGLTDHFGEPVSDGSLMAGDVVTMRWSGEENHVALVTDHPHGLGVIHCYAFAPGGARGGRVIEHRLSNDWRNRIVEVWRPFAEGAE